MQENPELVLSFLNYLDYFQFKNCDYCGLEKKVIVEDLALCADCFDEYCKVEKMLNENRT